MNGDLTDMKQLTLLYDPLCGWCYGASASIRRLADEATCTVELIPVGLFAGAGARPLSGFAQHAWASDQRIAQLTGMPFSTRYREQVLGDPAALLDSGPATLALTAVARVASERELPILEAIQAARYVDGRDVTSVSVLAELLRQGGCDDAASLVLESPPELVTAAAGRMSLGRSWLQTLGGHGVPTLVVHERGVPRVVPSPLLYGRIDELRRDLGVCADGPDPEPRGKGK